MLTITKEEGRNNADINVRLISKIIQRDDDKFFRIVSNGKHSIDVLCHTSEVFIQLIIGEPFDNRLAHKLIYDSIGFKINDGDVFFRTQEDAEKALGHIIDLLCERNEAGEFGTHK